MHTRHYHHVYSALVHNAALSAQQQSTLAALLSWPPGHVFPALDLCRLLALGPAASQVAQLASGWATGALQCFPCCCVRVFMCMQNHPQTEGPLVAAAKDPSSTSAHLTALRLLTNCYQSTALTSWLTGAREQLLDAFAGCATSGSKGVRQALAALLLNHAVAAKGATADVEDWLPQVLSAVLELLGNAPVDDAETLHRCGPYLADLVCIASACLLSTDARLRRGLL